MISIAFIIVMILLAFGDIRTTKSPKHRDFKNIIITLGFLGSFIELVILLQDFDTNYMNNSLSIFLNGAKSAFYSLIVGVALYSIISLYQKSLSIKTNSKDSIEFLSLQSKKLDELESIKDGNMAIKEAILELNATNKQILESNASLITQIKDSNNALMQKITESSLESSNKIIDSIKNIAVVLNTNEKNLAIKLNSIQNDMNAKLESLLNSLEHQISLLDKNINSKLDSMVESFALHLKDIRAILLDEILKQIEVVNFNITKELEKLSANFSSDVICSMNNLQESYINTINTHFSENFKRFSTSVDNLLSYQMEHKKDIAESKKILSSINNNQVRLGKITESILKRDESAIALYKEIGSIMQAYKAQNEELQDKLNTLNDLRKGAFEALKFMNTFFKELNSYLRSTNENVISNLKTSSEAFISSSQKSLKDVFFNAVNEFEQSNKKILSLLNTRDDTMQKQLLSSQKSIEELSSMMLHNNEQISQSYHKLSKDLELNVKAISKNASEMISDINKDGINHLKDTTKLYFDDITNVQHKVLNSISKEIAQTQETLDSALVRMITRYLESLEQINLANIESNKELNSLNLENIRVLNDEISSYIKDNAESLHSTNMELLNILEILQKQVEIASLKTNEMQDITKTSLESVKDSMQTFSNEFRGDYDWFLRRIKEIIGQRT